MPFEIPSSWEWVKLDDFVLVVTDGDHQPPPQSQQGVPFLVISDVNTGVINFENARYVSQSYYDSLPFIRKATCGDILFTVTGSYGIVIKVDTPRDFCFQRHIGLIKTILCTDWLYYALQSQYIKCYCDDVATGTAQKTVSLGNLRTLVIPIPPLKEQVRIVAELERLFAIIDSIENSKCNLQESIRVAKSKILDLAIHGKLVLQDPNDEPASELLKRIAPHATPCDTSHYENLPQGWAICRLSDIAKITAGGTPSRKITSYWEGGTIPWLKIADMTASGKYVRTASEYITEEGMKNSSAKLMNKGTLLYTIFASIGEVGILDFDATCNQAIANIDLYMPEMTDYIYYYLKNLQTYMYSISKGCTQQNINQGILKNATIPLPPLAEQKRIVERIETIFTSLDTITAEL